MNKRMYAVGSATSIGNESSRPNIKRTVRTGATIGSLIRQVNI